MSQMHVLVVCEKYNLVLTEETMTSFALILACTWHSLSTESALSVRPL